MRPRLGEKSIGANRKYSGNGWKDFIMLSSVARTVLSHIAANTILHSLLECSTTIVCYMLLLYIYTNHESGVLITWTWQYSIRFMSRLINHVGLPSSSHRYIGVITPSLILRETSLLALYNVFFKWASELHFEISWMQRKRLSHR